METAGSSKMLACIYQIIYSYIPEDYKLYNLQRKINFFLWNDFKAPRLSYISQYRVVSIATSYQLDTRGVRVRVPVGSRISLLHVVHPTSYPMGTMGSYPGGKAAGAWSWPLTSSLCWGQENLDLYIHSPICLHGAVLN
jgi:hypothetical protein